MPNTSKSVQLENAIANSVRPGDTIPRILPDWMVQLGFIPKDVIVSSSRIGTHNRTHKTDVIIKLKQSPPFKISAKLSNADYFGNWYGHKRFVEEFGNETFAKMTARVTLWANQWILNPNASLFVGVSICFGYRTGNTSIPFLEVFDNVEELIKIVAGFGEGEGTANCLYISDEHPSNTKDLIEKLLPINYQTILEQTKDIKVICRPINPMTERSNRGKNIYTKFQPHQRLSGLITLQKLEDLIELGNFTEVEPNQVNHNHILKILKQDYNIEIPCK